MRYGIVLASLPGGSGTHRTARQHSCVACKAGAAATQVDGCGRTRKSITGSRYFGSGVTIGTKGGRGCSARPRDEDGTEDKDISITFPSGQTRQFTGQSLLLGYSLPNFWFHTTTAYDIVRQCGVEVGKRDFMGMPPAS